MKRSKYTEEQIAFALRQAETGTRVEQICRKFGVSQATFYKWDKKYGGLGVSELRHLKQLDAECSRLKKLVADLSLNKRDAPGGRAKKAVRPALRRELGADVVDAYRASGRRAVSVTEVSRSYYYRHHPMMLVWSRPGFRRLLGAASLWRVVRPHLDAT